jgi:hypothetical protein
LWQGVLAPEKGAYAVVLSAAKDLLLKEVNWLKRFFASLRMTVLSLFHVETAFRNRN